MKKELLALLEYWERDRGIDKGFLLSSLERGLQSVYRKKALLDENVEVKIDPETGDIYFVDAQGKKVAPPEFPWERIAARTAKQILVQKIREAEKMAVFQEFKQMENEIVTGRVERFENGNIVVSLGKAEALLPQKHLLPHDHYQVGSLVKGLLLEVRKPNKGVYPLIMSRTASDFVKQLLFAEIPELRTGIVEIKSIARFPGDLTKIAVHSNDEKIDPVGTCIGDKANRIRNIIREIGGEKIEVVRWDADPEKFTANALAPAKCDKVSYNPEKNEAVVWVGKEQLFLAIGKKGQNVRLACKLTGWNIIVNRLEMAEEKSVISLLGIGDEVAEKLRNGGYETIKTLAGAGEEELMHLTGLSLEEVRGILEKARQHLQQTGRPDA